VGVKQLEFQEFYLASRDGCLRAVLASVGDRQLAEDLVAEAFTWAWVSWRTVSRHPAPHAWVVRTAMNTRVSWWRRSRREISYEEPPEGVAAEAADGIDPGLLRGLPRRQREVVVFRVFLDLGTKGTAAVLGIAPGTVTAHLSRAVAALREHYILLEEAGS
jgi:RNA polymerase sigma factor (sigma-70 family)